MTKNISAIRKEYTSASLSEHEVLADPVKQFENWFNEALSSEVNEPTAMTLCTVSEKGIPSVRVVLLKGIEDGLFEFYTNYQSQKGQEMDKNPIIALNFFWPELERQVRINGMVARQTKEKSTEYFQSRPKGSQIGAWASPQSSIIKGREILEERVNKLAKRHEKDEQLPKPEQWGGYVVTPYQMEFWQGRPSRLHDRILYTKKDKKWVINRLAP